MKCKCHINQRKVSGERTNGKQGKCSHTCYFCIPAGCKNACWGASPNPALWDKMSQSNCLRHRRLSLLFLSALAVRDAQQMIDIGLDRHGLPHLLLRRSVVSVECLFPRRQLAAFFF